MSAVECTEVINEEIRIYGYFVIITSEKMTAQEALDLYKGRDVSRSCSGETSPFFFNFPRKSDSTTKMSL